MKRHPNRMIFLPATVLGFALLLALGATNPAHADWKAYFIKSNSSSCADFYAEMDTVHGTGFSGTVYADVLATGISDGIYVDSVAFGGIQEIEVDASSDRTSFTWEDITVPDAFTTVGINMVCIKAGNARTCWKTDFDKDIDPAQVFTDLNTTSKIGSAWLCSDSESQIADGGPDCDYKGEALFELFNALGSNHGVVTFYDGDGNPSTCAAPGTTISSCANVDAYAPIGDDTEGNNDSICDPTHENCCTIDTVCAENHSTAAEILENCQLTIGGQPSSTGYQKFGDNTCITYGPSGDGSPVQICW